jgi:hypothetical protein
VDVAKSLLGSCARIEIAAGTVAIVSADRKGMRSHAVSLLEHALNARFHDRFRGYPRVPSRRGGPTKALHRASKP